MRGVSGDFPATFAGSPERYAVPRHSDVTSVTLKLWGAGGGGALTPASADVLGGNDTSNSTQGRQMVKMLPHEGLRTRKVENTFRICS